MSTIFLAGVYGVGKNTLGALLSQKTGYPFFSAGDLISKINGEQYGANKNVKDKDSNQKILEQEVLKLLQQNENIILAGHFCILNTQGNIEEIPLQTFYNLQIKTIILLETTSSNILEHLMKRDQKRYDPPLIKKLQHTEHKRAEEISSGLACPLIIHNMKYDQNDLMDFLNQSLPQIT